MNRTVSSRPKYFSVPKVGVVVRRIAKAVVSYKSHDSRTSVESMELTVWLEAWGLRKLQHPTICIVPTGDGRGKAQGLAQIQRVEIYQSICAPRAFMWRGI